MARNTIFILIGNSNLMKIVTFLINIEDNHPKSEVKVIIKKSFSKTLQNFLNKIKLNLNVTIEISDNAKYMFYKSYYDMYLLETLIEDNNVIVISGYPYMQCGLPVDKFFKDFGGLEIKDGIYALDFAYFTSPSLVKDLINRLKNKYEETCFPKIENSAALFIQKAWLLYKNKKFDNECIKKSILDVRYAVHKLTALKYEFKDTLYTIDNLDYEILIKPEACDYSKKIITDLLKNENGIITYNSKKCSLLYIPTKNIPINPKYKKFIDTYLKYTLESHNNVRNNTAAWNDKPFTIKWCLVPFMGFSVKDEYLSNFIIYMRNPNIYQIEYYNEPLIKLGCDPVYIYNYPTSAQFTPNLLSSKLIILPYPMKDKDISILDEYNIKYYYLNMNLPQSIQKIVEIQKLNLKKEKDLYSLGCHKSLILENLDKEKKEYGEYLRNVSRSKYMVVYNDDKYNKCTQITEALAFGTIPILVKQNNIIINNDNFKEGIHYILADITEVENKISEISEEEYNKLKQNCIDFYNKYESEEVFNAKLIRFFTASYDNFIKTE